MNIRHVTASPGLAFAAQGTGLTELMIALVIGLVLSGAAITIYINNKHAYQVQDNTARLQENGRFALHLLREDIRLAGYWGLNTTPETISNIEAIALANECTTDWATDYTNPLSFVNNTNAGYRSCIPDADYKSNTDILTIRHSSSEPLINGDIAKDNIYLLTSLTEGAAFQAEAASAIDPGVSISESPKSLYLVLAHTYYIRPFSQSGDDISTLVREKIIGGAVAAEPLVEYIEDFQITFGLDTDRDGSVDLYDKEGAFAGNIGTVVSIMVEVLARSPTAEAGYTNTRTYELGDQIYTVNDGFRRQVFRNTVFLRNWAGMGK